MKFAKEYVNYLKDPQGLQQCTPCCGKGHESVFGRKQDDDDIDGELYIEAQGPSGTDLVSWAWCITCGQEWEEHHEMCGVITSKLT